MQLISQVAEYAETRPGEIALIGGGDKLTYLGLRDRMRSLSAELERCGVGPGSTVALLVPNSIAFVVSLLALMEMDACAVLPDPHTVELGAMLSGLGIHFVIHSDDSVYEAEDQSEVVALQTPLCMQLLLHRHSPCGPSRHGVMQFTSGTTSRSLAVLRTPGNIDAELEGLSSVYGHSALRCTFSPAPLFHSFPLMTNCLVALYCGGSVVLQPVSPAASLWQAVASHRVTLFSASPFIYRLLLRSEYTPQLDGELPMCVSAGELLSAELYKGFTERFGLPIHSLYGSTETGALSVCRAGGLFVEGCVGPPLPNVEIGLWPSEDADTGASEVAVRGPSIFGGYLNGSDGGEERFREGWFLTNDLGELDGDGRLHIRGRKRHVINLGGRKVNPTEVASAICQHPAVSAARVRGESDGQSTYLVAYAVTTEPVSEQELRRFCAGCLAPVQVPRIIHFVESIPTSPLGKQIHGLAADDQAAGQ